MKSLILFVTASLSSLAMAGSITVGSGPAEHPALRQLPAETIGLLSDNGLTMNYLGRGVYEIALYDFHCDMRSRGPFGPEQPLAGISTTTCLMNSEDKADTTFGVPFSEGRILTSILGKLSEMAPMATSFTSCAAGGYCGTFASSIVCKVNTRVADQADGRYTCTYTDGY